MHNPPPKYRPDTTGQKHRSEPDETTPDRARRQFLTSSLSTALSAALSTAASPWLTAPLLSASAAAATPRQQPALGVHLPLWHQGSTEPVAFWQQTYDQLQQTGLKNCLILVYQFVNPQTGRISEQSAFRQAKSPDLAFLEQGLILAKERGLSASLYPVLEIENKYEIGAVWRGYVNFFGATLESFFRQYNDRILALARLAASHDAKTVYLGSELASLTHNRAATPYWDELIYKLRMEVRDSPTHPELTYAAHWEEYLTVPFWRQLDSIAINAYFPLASKQQAEGIARPLIEEMATTLKQQLGMLKSFAAAHKRPLEISEFGLTGYDLATALPWARRPSEIEDKEEQANGYKALLKVIEGEGDWLKAVNFWHWKMPGRTGSSYNITPASPLIRAIEDQRQN